ncbi:NAD(P)-dependent oxidoreductase [Negadavirga shengliensis]|uniref:NAD(P)-dependent oxidoreductase n=1 Tax=Negadavirga shengliensis TaxID=1389218 RepID=A0ABV9T8X3_9BACT
MMKIAVIGATGFVGPHLVREALERGHEVTAIVRDPSKVKLDHPQLDVVQGDILDAADTSRLLEGHEAVLSAYNPGWENPRLYEEYLEGAMALQRAAKKAGVKRLLVIGGAGSLEIAPGVQLVDTPEFPSAWKAGATAARDYLNILKKETELEWTFLSPAIEMHAGITTGRTGKYRQGTDQPVFDDKGVSRISAEDLVVALLDELENGAFINRRFTVAY